MSLRLINTVACPKCGAAVGQPCVYPNAKTERTHTERDLEGMRYLIQQDKLEMRLANEAQRVQRVSTRALR